MEASVCHDCGRALRPDATPGGLCPFCLLKLGGEASSADSARSTEVRLPSSHPQRIGDYRILRVLGAGGMGIVYEAEQQHPQRPVALKVIRGGRYVDDNTVRLFRREAQTLARLRHSGIAQIYEAGRTEDGQHFFAMELVRGETLDRYAASHPPPQTGGAWLAERLALFRKICDAVNYAHQRGVIHRDLKPGNVLVLPLSPSSGGNAGASVTDVKILDFGLARITDVDMAVSTVVTDLGKVQGTLPYMSPEQLRGNPDEVDLRTDVYSLGVVLYELLTGRLPYDLGNSLPEAMRAIDERVPEPPGRAWQGPGRLDRDLETIVLKALEKEPGRRYQNAAALSEDLGRFLGNQPILARPATALYQLRKMVARHRLGFAFGASVVVLLAGFAVALGVQARRIARERDRANREAEGAGQVSEFLEGLFRVVDPGEARGNSITAREILDQGAVHIQEELSGQPGIQARLMGTMGRVYRGLGLYGEARPLLEESLELRRATEGEASLAAADGLQDLGDLEFDLGRYAEARQTHERALTIRRSLLAGDDLRIAASLMSLGSAARELGDLQQAETCHRQALSIREARLGPEEVDTAWSRYHLALDLLFGARLEEARALYQRSLPVFERAFGEDHQAVAWCLNDLGAIAFQQEDFLSADRFFRRAMSIKEKVLGPWHLDVARERNNLGYVLMMQGDLVGARDQIERSLAIAEASTGADSLWVTQILHSLGEVLRKTRDFDSARAALERAIAIVNRDLSPDHPQAALLHGALASVHADAGDAAAADREFLKALEIWDRAGTPGMATGAAEMVSILESYAVFLRGQGREEAAAGMGARAAGLRDHLRGASAAGR